MTNAQHDAYICQQYLTDELNNRIFNRYFPTQTLEPMFEFRAVNTREETMPIFDCRKKSKGRWAWNYLFSPLPLYHHIQPRH